MALIFKSNLTTRSAPTMGSWHWGYARLRFEAWLAHRKVPPSSKSRFGQLTRVVRVGKLNTALSLCAFDINLMTNLLSASFNAQLGDGLDNSSSLRFPSDSTFGQTANENSDSSEPAHKV